MFIPGWGLPSSCYFAGISPSKSHAAENIPYCPQSRTALPASQAHWHWSEWCLPRRAPVGTLHSSVAAGWRSHGLQCVDSKLENFFHNLENSVEFPEALCSGPQLRSASHRNKKMLLLVVSERKRVSAVASLAQENDAEIDRSVPALAAGLL